MTRPRAKTDPAHTTRCAVYTRKSSDEGLDQEFNSLDAQREASEAYIASQKNEGWTCLPDRYDDGGYSGGDIDRPGVQRLLADIAAGKIDCVIVYKVDRLSRSLMDFARMMETFEKHGVSFVSVTQQFNTTHSMGRLTLNILLSFAQFEREIIGERIRDKIAAQRRKGKWAGGVPVLGYDVDRSQPSPKLLVNAAEARRVRDIFRLYLDLCSLLPVVQELARRGWCNKEWTTANGQPKGGRPFDKCTLYALLTNPIFAGKIKHKDELFEGEHEPIISPEDFRRVQARLSKNGRTGGAEVRNRYGALLKGVLKCRACGRAMVHTFTGKGQRRYRYYTCTTAIKNGWEKCPARSLPASEIERVVLDQIRDIGQDAGLRADVLQQAQVAVDSELAVLRTDCKRHERELARHHADIRRLATRGAQTSATTARIADLHEQITLAEQHCADLRSQIDELVSSRIDAADVATAFSDFDAMWQSLTPNEQARMIVLLVDRVDYDAADSTVSVTFHPTGIQTLAEGRLEGAA